MSSSETRAARKPVRPLYRIGMMVLAVVMILAGPVMIGIGTLLVDADTQTAQTGIRATGTIIDFDDSQRASQRDITVKYASADGMDRRVVVPVGQDQHPAVGTKVTVAYRGQEPARAVVLGYESGGVTIRGVGTILTLVFTTTGLIFVLTRIRRKRGKKRVR